MGAILSSGGLNTAVGAASLNSNTTGGGNSALGVAALASNTIGIYNVAVGIGSMQYNTIGAYNVSLGSGALRFGTSSSQNTAIGHNALAYNTTGQSNIALGIASGGAHSYQQPFDNTESVIDDYMVFLGPWSSRDGSLVQSTTKLTNGIAIGYRAQVGGSNMMALGGTGSNAVKVGIGTTTPTTTLTVIGSGYFSSGLGVGVINNTAGTLSVSGNALIGGNLTVNGTTLSASNLTSIALADSASSPTITIGNATAATNVLGSNWSINSTGNASFAGSVNVSSGSAYLLNGVKLAYGSTALNNYFFGNAGNTSTVGQFNNAIGHQSLYSNTNGQMNIGIGSLTLSANTTGSNNVVLGYASAYMNTTGSDNNAQGTNALFSNTTGGNNIAMGFRSLFYSNGSNNIALGARSLEYLRSGDENIALGASSLAGVSTSSGMIAIGTNAGYQNSTSSYSSLLDTNSIFIGRYASRDNNTPSTTALTNAIAIGYNAKVGASSTMVLGGIGSDSIKVGIGTSTPAFPFQVYVSSTVEGHVNAATGAWANTSDANLKTNVSTINDALSKIMGLNPVHYDWLNDPVSYGQVGRHTGFIAQQVEQILPELVDTDSSGRKSLSYALFTPLLAGAIQDQQTQINQLKSLVGTSSNHPVTTVTSLNVASSDSSNLFDSLEVTESATFYGTISVIGEAGFESKVTFKKEVEFQDHISVDADTAGTAIIATGTTSTLITFAKPYQSVPKVVASANLDLQGNSLWVDRRSTSSFRINLSHAPASDIELDWIALANTATTTADLSDDSTDWSGLFEPDTTASSTNSYSEVLSLSTSSATTTPSEIDSSAITSSTLSD